MSRILCVESVSHCYAGQTVLREVSFSVDGGEIFSLLGPSGAGKTTLVKILTGQLSQTGGAATLWGEDTRRLSAQTRRGIGAMMDDLGLYDRFTAEENLSFYAALTRAERTRGEELLRRCGLWQARKTPAARLSKGMRNRLALARALLGGPRLLFLDEPTAGLDPAAARGIWRLLEEEREKGMTILLTTHNMVEAQRLCDRVALLHEGRIVALGAPEALCRQHNRQNGLLITLKDGQRQWLENGPAAAPELCRWLEREQLAAIHSTEPTLEEVFLNLTGRRLEDEQCGAAL